MQHRKELVHYSTDLELRIVALHCLFYKYPACWPLCVPCNTFPVLHMHEDLIWIWAAMPRSGDSDSDSALLSISLSLAVQGEISTSAISRLSVHSVVSALMFSQIVNRPPRGTEQLSTEHQHQIQCRKSINRWTCTITEKAPILGPSPGWKRLLPLSHLTLYCRWVDISTRLLRIREAIKKKIYNQNVRTHLSSDY